MSTTRKTRKSHGSRQPVIDSSTMPVRTRSWAAEAGIRGSGASPPPLLTVAEVDAHLCGTPIRCRPMTKNATARKHSGLVWAGPHESRGIPDARYLGIADRVLNQEVNKEGDADFAGDSVHFSEQAPSYKSNATNQRDARYLLHYRQEGR